VLPTTQSGRLAVALAAASVVVFLAWTIVRAGGGIGFVFGWTGRLVALVSIVRHGERAITVFVAWILPLVLTVAFVLADMIVGHD
jgi:hypothetical protein